MIHFAGTSRDEMFIRRIWITISVLISVPHVYGRERREKGALLFIVSKKKVQKQKGFVDAKISLYLCVPLTLAPHARLHKRTRAYKHTPPDPLSAAAAAPYLQTHYTRFVLKTVQFIGGRLAYPLSAALILLFEGVSRCGPQDKSDLWLAQGTLWSLRSLITATPGAALSSGALAITHANPLLYPVDPPPRVFICILCMCECVSRGGFYKSADGSGGVLWRSH